MSMQRPDGAGATDNWWGLGPEDFAAVLRTENVRLREVVPCPPIEWVAKRLGLLFEQDAASGRLGEYLRDDRIYPPVGDRMANDWAADLIRNWAMMHQQPVPQPLAESCGCGHRVAIHDSEGCTGHECACKAPPQEASGVNH